MVGIIGSESGQSLQIKVPGVGDQSIIRNQIKSLTSLDHSLMPNGLEAGLTHQNVADLIEFLKTYKWCNWAKFCVYECLNRELIFFKKLFDLMRLNPILCAAPQ